MKCSEVERTYAIPQPVGGSRESNATRANWQWIDLANNDPGTWSPRCGEKEDVNANKSDHSFDGAWVLTVGHTNDGNDEFTIFRLAQSQQKVL